MSLFAQRDLERLLAAADLTETESLQTVAAQRLAGQSFAQVDPAQTLGVWGLHDVLTVRAVAERLALLYPPEHTVYLLHGDVVQPVRLAELVQTVEMMGGQALLAPPLPYPGAYSALQEVVARLRAPDGCPWDRELTWDKLRASLLEEAHELLAALDSGEPRKVMEEQGDLLLQVAMQVQIAAEQGLYRPGEVIRQIVEKLIRRHPHVFGDAALHTSEEVLANWEVIKRAERERSGEKRSPLAGIPAALPALAQAQAYLDRMARLQTLSTDPTPWAGLADLPAEQEISAHQFGEALFGLVGWARAHGIDAESALRAVNQNYAADVARQLS